MLLKDMATTLLSVLIHVNIGSSKLYWIKHEDSNSIIETETGL